MKELREERTVSIENSKLTPFGESACATNPIGIGAEIIPQSKVVGIPSKALLKNIKIIKKTAQKKIMTFKRLLLPLKNLQQECL